MCLIVYSPKGEPIERRTFEWARYFNPDGIGVMSSRGVGKFTGRGCARRAWQYLNRLAASRVPHGIHFRLATHGKVTRRNCHPFQAPRSDAIVMHNGILVETAEMATPQRSDTSIFVERNMAGAPGPESSCYARYYQHLGNTIGRDNRLLVFHTLTESFTICNEDEGEWIGGHWYSNNYCLPLDMTPRFGGRLETVERLDLNYSDRNSRDAIDNTVRYYAEVSEDPRYFDDGVNLRKELEGWLNLEFGRSVDDTASV